MKKSVKRVGKRLSSHPKLTPEKQAELNQAAIDEDAYYLSPEGQAELKQRKAELKKKISKRGGLRPGSGRPTDGDEPKQMLSTRLDAEIIAYLRQCEQPISSVIERTIRRTADFAKWTGNKD